MFVDVYNRFYYENDCFINKRYYDTNMQYNKGNGRLVERRRAIDSRTFLDATRPLWPSTVPEPSTWRWLR